MSINYFMEIIHVAITNTINNVVKEIKLSLLFGL